MKKANTAKPPAKLAKPTKPEPAWKFQEPPPGGMTARVGIDQTQATLTFRPASPAVIGRPVDAEAEILAKAKEIPAVVRYQPMRAELARLQELVRTARACLEDAERNYEDAAGDDDITDLAYQVDACRQQLHDDEKNLARFAALAEKAYELARQECAKLSTTEQAKFVDSARQHSQEVAAEIIPQLNELVSQLAEARCGHLVALRMAALNVGNLIGERPRADTPAPQSPPPLVTNKPVLCGAGVMQ